MFRTQFSVQISSLKCLHVYITPKVRTRMCILKYTYMFIVYILLFDAWFQRTRQRDRLKCGTNDAVQRNQFHHAAPEVSATARRALRDGCRTSINGQ